MVLLNTQTNQHDYRDINFRYLFNIPGCDCTFGSARGENGKAHLFLIFDRGKIYARRGLNSTWEELKNTYACSQVRQKLVDAIHNNIPQFTTDSGFKLN